jgi:hypothetical protein
LHPSLFVTRGTRSPRRAPARKRNRSSDGIDRLSRLRDGGDALVPRLIAAFGTDRERYSSAEQIQRCSGIAPITKQSGKSRYVYCRYACPKFLRQTFHEFAD